MLRLTSQATDHLMRLRAQHGADANALPRFVRRSGRLALTFVRGPEQGDLIVDGGRLSTLVAPSAADLLEDRTIDVKATDGKAVLVAKHRRPVPEAKQSPNPNPAGA
jgi:Fe-S cluster assembly iron-binding protein IscA